MRILFFIVGVGAGNTTRNLAIFEELRRLDPTLELHIAAQGRAYDLMTGRGIQVHRLREVTYSHDGSFSLANIVLSNLNFPVRFMENRASARRLMERLRPDLVVADSDFYCLAPARDLGIPLASINNSAGIVEFMNRGGIPRHCWFSATFIERTDYWLQRRYPNMVLCPMLTPMKGLARKFRQIPPIVRPGFTPTDERSGDVVVVTGGSGIGAQEIDLRAVKAPLVTYGTPLEKVPRHARQMGFQLDVVEAMKRARVLVVQGGFSSVSEAQALHRPTVVVPIARHAEQHVNAMMMEKLGIGLAASGPDAGRKVNSLLRDYEKFDGRSRGHEFPSDGALRAAKLILGMAAS